MQVVRLLPGKTRQVMQIKHIRNLSALRYFIDHEAETNDKSEVWNVCSGGKVTGRILPASNEHA